MNAQDAHAYAVLWTQIVTTIGAVEVGVFHVSSDLYEMGTPIEHEPDYSVVRLPGRTPATANIPPGLMSGFTVVGKRICAYGFTEEEIDEARAWAIQRSVELGEDVRAVAVSFGRVAAE